MKMKAAVVYEQGQAKPYADSQAVKVEMVDLAGLGQDRSGWRLSFRSFGGEWQSSAAHPDRVGPRGSGCRPRSWQGCQRSGAG